MPLAIKMVSEVFVELAVSHFNSTEVLGELDKLKFTPENKLKVALGLRVVGFTLYSGLGSIYFFKHLTENYKYTENQTIELRDSYLIESFNALSNSVKISGSSFREMWDSYLKSIYGDIQKGIENPEYIWGENEHGGLKMGGILGVVLRRVFKTRGTREIFSDTDIDLFTFLEVALYFDSLFKACMTGLETDITEILRKIDN